MAARYARRLSSACGLLGSNPTVRIDFHEDTDQTKQDRLVRARFV